MKEFARLIPDCAVLARRMLRDPRVARRTRWLLLGLLGYLALPFDLVPDFVPVAGYVDDVLVVGLVLGAILRPGTCDVAAELWPGTPQGLELVRRASGRAAAIALAVLAASFAAVTAILVATGVL